VRGFSSEETCSADLAWVALRTVGHQALEGHLLVGRRFDHGHAIPTHQLGESTSLRVARTTTVLTNWRRRRAAQIVASGHGRQWQCPSGRCSAATAPGAASTAVNNVT
jgi:hypothetical protein